MSRFADDASIDELFEAKFYGGPAFAAQAAAFRDELEAASIAADGEALALEARAAERCGKRALGDQFDAANVAAIQAELARPDGFGPGWVDRLADSAGACPACPACGNEDTAPDADASVWCFECGTGLKYPVGDSAPSPFPCEWRDAIAHRADADDLALVALQWDAMAERERRRARIRAIQERTLPDRAAILARLLDSPNPKAAGRAASAIVEGVAIRRERDALVIGSKTDAGREWTVTAEGCGCRASGHCWHQEVYRAVFGGGR
jgi:hypothetical protein